MKNFKRVLSLALAALMVIGGLVVAPVDAKADTIYTQVTDLTTISADKSYVIVEPNYKVIMATTGISTSAAFVLGYDTVTLSGNELTYTGTKNVAWTIEPTATGTSTSVSVKISSNGNYINKNSSNKFSKATASASAETWTIAETATAGVYTIASTSVSGRYIEYNANTNQERFAPYAGTQHGDLMIFEINGEGGSVEGPTDITLPADATPDQIIEAAYKAKDDGVALLGTWTLTGVIQSITDAYTGGSDYKNVDVTIKVGDNEKLMRCYRVVNGTNVTLDDLQGLGVGDTITVTGTISYYGSSVQYVAGSTIDEVEKAAVVIPDIELPTDATPEQIINAAYQAKEDGVHLLGTWTLTGVITTITDAYTGDSDYKNVDVTIKVGDIEKVMRCYRVVNGTDVTLDDLQGLAEGDTITVTGTITWYGDSVQFAQGSTIDSIVKATVDDPNGSEDDSTTGSEDDSTTGSEEDEMTAAEILAAAGQLTNGQYLGGSKDVKYTLKGVITEYEFNEQYGDASITIKVDGTDETFYCYQVKGEDVKNLKVGDRIELNGAIKNYQGTIEFERPNLVAILPTGDFSSVGTVMILIAGIACLAVAFTSKKKMA